MRNKDVELVHSHNTLFVENLHDVDGEVTPCYNGNQLTSVQDTASPLLYSGAFDFKNGTTIATEYVYDGCGSLKQDKNKGIALIDYDYNGMPTRIQFRNGNVTEHVYSADGVKLKTVHRTAVSGINVAYGTRHTLTASETLSADSICYIGDLEYRKGQNIKWYFGEGYVQLPVTGYGATQHYMIADHLGNVRVVVKEDGTVEQVNSYFAYGGILNNGDSGVDVQTHKYNGKELDRMHGLDLYDYGARNYDAAIGQFTTMDPLCEKYYHVSPYVYCGGNPVNRVDVDGMDIWELSVNGQITWKEKSENHQLVALDEKGNRTNNSITVTDRSILDQLSENREGTDSNYAITQLSEVSTVFLFAANNSNVEWSLSGYNNGKKKIYVLGTDYSDDSVTPDMGVKYAHFKESDMLFDVHSHPSVKDDVRGASGGDRGKNSYYGDMKGITFRYYRFRDNYKTSLPPHYVYHKKSRNLYNYTPWESSIYIKHIKSHNGLNFLIPPKK